MDVPEFQRQISLPNLPKFVSALITLVEKETNVDITVRAHWDRLHACPPYYDPTASCARDTGSHGVPLPLALPPFSCTIIQCCPPLFERLNTNPHPERTR